MANIYGAYGIEQAKNRKRIQTFLIKFPRIGKANRLKYTANMKRRLLIRNVSIISCCFFAIRRTILMILIYLPKKTLTKRNHNHAVVPKFNRPCELLIVNQHSLFSAKVPYREPRTGQVVVFFTAKVKRQQVHPFVLVC